ncbi:MAG: sensor histidine kinase, partial [Chloroflexota bacterium]
TEQRRRERHRATLSRIGQALSQSLNSEAVLETAMDQILEVLGADTVDIHLADAERRELVLAGYRNLTPETVRMLQHVPYDGPFLTSRAFATGEIQVIEDTLQSSPELVGARMLTELENLRSILAVPLVTAGCPIGAMVLGTRSVRRFAADELETITQAAALFGTAIENARLYRESQHRAEELEEQRRRREEFVSVVVHELRAPLTVLGGYTQILRRQTAVDPERQRQALGVMAEQLQKLGGLVSELQDSARIEAGRFTVERAPMDLVDTARHVVEEQQATTTRHQVLIETPDGPIEGRWDRGRIAQALTNLVSNAIKYSPEGGEVRVVVHRKAGEAKVSVSDRGIGIGAEEVPLLFQPYSRLRRERRAGGVGLGLYITKGIVEAHGGRIWVVSERGQGSTFYFMLPLDGKVAGER